MFRLSCWLILLSVLSLTGCAMGPTAFYEPELDPVFITETKMSKPQLDARLKPLSLEYDKSLNWSENYYKIKPVVWIDDETIGLKNLIGRNKWSGKGTYSYHIYSVVLGESYKIEDVNQISKIEAQFSMRTIDMKDTTHQNSTLFGQAVFYLDTKHKKSVQHKGYVTDRKGNGRGLIMINDVIGPPAAVSGIKAKCYFSGDSDETRGWRIPETRTAFLSDDHNYLIDPNQFVFDVRNGEVLLLSPVSQTWSLPPTIVGYALSPDLNKLAVVYFNEREYLIDIQDVNLGKMINEPNTTRLYGDGVNSPYKVYACATKKEYVLVSYNPTGKLLAYADHFEFRPDNGSSSTVIAYSDIKEIDSNSLFDTVTIFGSDQKLVFGDDSFEDLCLFEPEEIVADLTRVMNYIPQQRSLSTVVHSDASSTVSSVVGSDSAQTGETTVHADEKQQSHLTSEESRYITMLQSNNSLAVRDAAKSICRVQSLDESVYNEVSNVLASGEQSLGSDANSIDALAWLCKALASSGNSKYKQVLGIASNSKNSKIRKYAAQAAKSL